MAKVQPAEVKECRVCKRVDTWNTYTLVKTCKNNRQYKFVVHKHLLVNCVLLEIGSRNDWTGMPIRSDRICLQMRRKERRRNEKKEERKEGKKIRKEEIKEGKN
jgi:hypothetical protein